LQKLSIPGFRIPSLFREQNGAYADPQRYPRLSVAQPATHDHPPLAAVWAECWQNIDEGKNIEGNRHELGRMMSFAGMKNGEPPREFSDEILEAFTRTVMKSPSWLVIFQITDVLAMTARFNTPGSVAATNWSYRLPMTVKQLEEDPKLVERAERFSRLSVESGRAS
jgi:4-alpha-glucanotransferase